MFNLSYEDVMENCIAEAVAVALDESRTMPLVPGTKVGHIDMQTYGTHWGTLVTINETSSTVEMKDGNIVTWTTDGMVAIERVDELTKNNLKSAINDLLELRRLENAMGVTEDVLNGPDLDSPGDIPFLIQEMLDNEGGIGGPDLPTPGCDCPHCATFSPEKHEEARLKAEELGLDFDPASR